ncbi:prepilin-type N-terminal cleavage/methylation domain-containing protein [bacterium]|nr:prepilin-type N-terminal cleavage/methylation domain-containing protein [bacterium]
MRRSGFTLIELLIVVAIIAILAAIALPNFLHAQIRAKVAQGVAEMRSICTALEAYRADNTEYPPFLSQPPTAEYHFILHPLTTPIAYLTQVPRDLFAKESSEDYLRANGSYFRGDGVDTRDYLYTYLRESASTSYLSFYRRYGRWVLWGHGPDLCRQSDPDLIYDPSNGLTSSGDIVFSQKEGYHRTSSSAVAGNVPYPRGRCGPGTPNP